MPCDSPYFVKNPTPYDGRDTIPVPCGRCPMCKIRRITEWTYRIETEEKHSAISYFITLTYDTTTVPISKKGFMTLDKPDLQKFFKRLRKNSQLTFKYYACGEYGSKRMRPHYHIIMMFKDYVSELDLYKHLQSAWQLGNFDIGTATTASIKYTLKYISKESRIPLHKNDDRLKEFNVQSKHIGQQYITNQIVNYHNADLSTNYITHHGYKIPLPKSFRNKILSAEAKEVQRKIITSSLLQKQSDDERKYLAENPNGDFKAYQALQRQQRYINFYNNKTSRHEQDF